MPRGTNYRVDIDRTTRITGTDSMGHARNTLCVRVGEAVRSVVANIGYCET